MKTYKIKEEYLDNWGADATENTILTLEDVEEITRGWDKTPEDVMDQLIELSYGHEAQVMINNGLFDAAVELMDDEIRERLHSELAPCSEQEFFTAYEQAHAERYGTDWELSAPNPVW